MDKNFTSDKNPKKNLGKDLYGIDFDSSLQSINFAPAENPYLNERVQKQSDDFY